MVVGFSLGCACMGPGVKEGVLVDGWVMGEAIDQTGPCGDGAGMWRVVQSL